MPAQKRKCENDSGAAKEEATGDLGSAKKESLVNAVKHTVNRDLVVETGFIVEYLKDLESIPRKKKDRLNFTTAKVEGPVSKFDGPVAYTVLPGKAWDAMKKYKNFVVSDNQFGVGDYIYVNHGEIQYGATIADRDERDFWIARVLEVRARDPQHVYLRVYWMYWPGELPGGRQSYHGKDELLASNHMEIIDALTVSERAQVDHYLETDESTPMTGLYWRQTFDYVRQKLSPLRKQCACTKYHNPDKLLIRCANHACDTWLHEDCIVTDNLDRFYMEPIAKSNAIHVDAVYDEGDAINVRSETSAFKKKKGRSRKSDSGPKIWEGKLEGRIEMTGEENESKDITGNLVITDMRGREVRTVVKDLNCPKCHESFKLS
ncbi:hypothetical protein MMC06_001162 [Schaereria dolodes]|nr:hypothetical protein [Schaereria dolodes]